MNPSKSISTKAYLEQPLYSAALAVFRLAFGLMLFGGIIRFWAHRWIEEMYIAPRFYFHYWGFEWIRPLGNYTYLLFVVCGISALLFALGLFYRLSAIVLFLSFTWIELLDKTNYLNHYYFVSLALFLMIWLPANANLSLDALHRPATYKRFLPRWTIGSIRLMLGIVYVYAGLAKLNSDWLLEAMPLRLWLPAKSDLWLVGPLLTKVWVAYAFSWFGAIYDLTVPLFLLNRKTRPYAFVAVVVFHVATSVLFPIGMFPYIMILATLIFFDSRDIDAVVQKCKLLFTKLPVAAGSEVFTFAPLWRKTVAGLFVVFFVIQLIVPWRYLLMPGELFWTEEGYRFSWRVMLMEKTGYAQFVVRDAATGKQVGVDNTAFLTPNQEKMMATQPDFMVQYAHMLRDHYRAQGMQDPRVHATVYVTLNGRRSRLFVDTAVDLATQKDGFAHKGWITDQHYKIYGL